MLQGSYLHYSRTLEIMVTVLSPFHASGRRGCIVRAERRVPPTAQGAIKMCFNFRRSASASIAWADKFLRNSCSLLSTDSPSSLHCPLPPSAAPLRSKCSTTHFFLSRLHSHLIKSIETAAAMLHACLSRPPRQPWGETRFSSMGTVAGATDADGRGPTGLASSRKSQPEAEGGEAETPARRSTSALVAEAHLPRLWLRREWTGQLAPRRRCSHGQARLAQERGAGAKALRNNRLRERVTFLRRKFSAGWLNLLTFGKFCKYNVIFLDFE